MEEQMVLASKLATVLPQLKERQRRLVLGAEARVLGHGGSSGVAQAARVSRTTVHAALAELDQAGAASEGSRRSGGGRKPQHIVDPTWLADLEALMEPPTRGDPMSPLRWTCKSTRPLAAVLGTQGHRVSHQTVARLLPQLAYSLQAPRKTREGSGHPDRDAQFDYLNAQVTAALVAGQPVVSVDAKKKERVGAFKNAGQEWQPAGQPERVKVHDFGDKRVGQAIPSGSYDVGRNAGWVNGGQDHDTAQFAIESLRRWWQAVGAGASPHADRLLICADGGGSHGARVRLWKVALHALADQTGWPITVCHLPPGTSKWNTSEHRLFAHISMNWRGRPLVSHEVMVALIGATSTRTGLTVPAVRATGSSPTNLKVSDEEFATVHMTPPAFHGEWNSTITPHATAA